MEIKNYSAYNEKEILKVYSSVGWTAYTDDPQALKQGFQNSLLVLAAYEREELLGIIRAGGDGVTSVFIQGAADGSDIHHILRLVGHDWAAAASQEYIGHIVDGDIVGDVMYQRYVFSYIFTTGFQHVFAPP